MKKRKRGQNRKKRTEWIYTTTGPTTTIALSYDETTDRIIFETPIVSSFQETTYEKDNGESGRVKRINRTPAESDKLHFSPNAALLRNYDVLVAVDTNTERIHQTDVSVTGVALAYPVIDSLGDAIAINGSYLLMSTNAGELAEKKGWVIALKHVSELGILSTSERIALIVDAYLGDIPEYNSGSKEIVSGFTLPSSVKLVYASSDTGSEYYSNRLISLADKAARSALRQLSTKYSGRDLTQTGYRVLFSQYSEFRPNMPAHYQPPRAHET